MERKAEESETVTTSKLDAAFLVSADRVSGDWGSRGARPNWWSRMTYAIQPKEEIHDNRKSTQWKAVRGKSARCAFATLRRHKPV